MRKTLLLAGVLLGAVSCGDGDTDPSPNPANATISITAAGATPSSVTINSGGRVTFINNDTVPHQPSSDPHPLHTDCTRVNLAVLNPNQQATTEALTVRRTCGFHDHLNDTNANLRGSIVVQ
jgi:plastocyanin